MKQIYLLRASQRQSCAKNKKARSLWFMDGSNYPSIERDYKIYHWLATAIQRSSTSGFFVAVCCVSSRRFKERIAKLNKHLRNSFLDRAVLFRQYVLPFIRKGLNAEFFIILCPPELAGIWTNGEMIFNINQVEKDTQLLWHTDSSFQWDIHFCYLKDARLRDEAMLPLI